MSASSWCWTPSSWRCGCAPRRNIRSGQVWSNAATQGRGAPACRSPPPLIKAVAAWVRWRKVGNDWELWFVSDGNGFQIVRFTNSFMAHNRSLFQGSGT